MTDVQEISTFFLEICGSGDLPFENLQNCDPFISADVRKLLETIFIVALNGAISVLGSAANVVNIIIFFKQGFSESINISLCGLAVSDLGSLLPLLWMSICFNPMFQFSDIGIDSVEIHYTTAGWPHGCFVWITSWITAFITFERCVCVALPMKVKDIITPKRTFILLVAIFMTMFASVSPVFCAYSIAPRINIQQNRTLIGLVHFSNAETLEKLSSSINVFTQLSCLIIVIVSTVALIHNLRSNSQWRHKVTSCSHPSNSDSLSKRDKRVIKMVTAISYIFIACYFPSAVNIILMVHFSSSYSIVGRYQNSFNVVWAILNTIEVVNSSVNIIVYYNMSSKFRASFNELLGIGHVHLSLMR